MKSLCCRLALKGVGLYTNHAVRGAGNLRWWWHNYAEFRVGELCLAGRGSPDVILWGEARTFPRCRGNNTCRKAKSSTIAFLSDFLAITASVDSALGLGVPPGVGGISEAGNIVTWNQVAGAEMKLPSFEVSQ